MKAPKNVARAASHLIKQFGNHFEHLGEFQGQDAWRFIFPRGSCMGFPFIYVVSADDPEEVFEVTGQHALRILDLFYPE